MRLPQFVACLVAFFIPHVHANVGFAQKLDSLRLMPCGGMRGSEVVITLPGKFESWPIACWSSHPGIVWRATDTSGNVTATIAPDVPLGIHWVRFYTEHAASPLLRFVVGDIPEVTEVEPNNRFGEPQLLASSTIAINGVLQKSGDVDHFGLDLKKGERWSIAVDANRSLQSPMDACLQILDLRGNVVAQNLDYFGIDPALQWVCPKDGMYVIRIFAFPESPDSTIGYAGGDAYRYRIRSVVGDNPTWEIGFTEGAHAVEEPNDRSMPFVFSPKVAGTFHVPSSVTNQSDATAHGMCLLLSTRPHGMCLLLSTRPHGMYLLLSTRAEVMRLGENRNHVAFYGRMDARGDEDAVQFETVAPGHWKVQLRARELGSSMDAVLEILDASGKSLAKQGESGEVRDPTLVNQMNAPGKYTIVAKDLHQRSGPDVAYRLEFEDEVPTVKGTLASDILAGEVGKPIEVEVSLDRTFECADEVTIAVVGLPEGATCEPVVSKPGDDSAKKVQLKILATKPCSVPIRIEVQQSSQLRADGSALATNTKRPDLWLLVTGALP